MRDINQFIEHIVRDKLNVNEPFTYSFLSGGCINSAIKLTAAGMNYFLKWNDLDLYPKMFEKEAVGIDLLRKTGTVKMPEVLSVGDYEDQAYLLLEWLDSAPRSRDYWNILAEDLAQLHQNSHSEFGLDEYNYIGSLEQFNTNYSSWSEFFIVNRLQPMIALARNKGELQSSTQKKIESLFPKLDNYFPEEAPALIHGDLWSGNLMTGPDGKPWLIDPAVYYGHREMELALTTLFGGFSEEFYEHYNEVFPLEKDFGERIDLYNLYPLLVHLNLFGSSYLYNIQLTIKKYI